MNQGIISPVRYWIQHVLPVTFGNELSTIEVLYKCIDKLNEVICEINKLNLAFDELNSEYQLKLNALEEELLAIIKAGDDANNQYTDEQIQLLKVKLEDKISLALLQLNHLIEQCKTDVISYVNLQIENLKNWVKLYVPKDIVQIINPFTGKKDSIQNIVFYIYEYYRYEAFTVGEFDRFNQSTEWWDKWELTAQEFDLWAKRLVHWFQWKFQAYFKMRDPFTGMIAPIKNVVYKLANNLMLGYTATEYTGFAFTAEQYKEKGITAYNYIWSKWNGNPGFTWNVDEQGVVE